MSLCRNDEKTRRWRRRQRRRHHRYVQRQRKIKSSLESDIELSIIHWKWKQLQLTLVKHTPCTHTHTANQRAGAHALSGMSSWVLRCLVTSYTLPSFNPVHITHIHALPSGGEMLLNCSKVLRRSIIIKCEGDYTVILLFILTECWSRRFVVFEADCWRNTDKRSSMTTPCHHLPLPFIGSVWRYGMRIPISYLGQHFNCL